MVERGLKYLERGMLLLVVLMTLAPRMTRALTVIGTGSVQLGDVLLMFLYTEVIAMVAVFYTGRGQPFVFPIFIAITALARLDRAAGQGHGSDQYRDGGCGDPVAGDRGGHPVAVSAMKMTAARARYLARTTSPRISSPSITASTR